MKMTKVSIYFVLALLFADVAYGQQPPGGGGSFTQPVTRAQLPASGIPVGSTRFVTDTDGTSCTASGIFTLFCRWTGSAWTPAGAGTISGGTGDVVGPASVAAGRAVNFSGTSGKAISESTLTGIIKHNSGVPQVATPGTDYLAPTGSAAALTGFPTLNQDTTGSAAVAAALAGSPTTCSAGQAARGITAAGNSFGCFTPAGTGAPGGSDTQLQRNSSGVNGGISGCTSDGTNVSCVTAALRPTRPRVTTSIDDSAGNQVIFLAGDGTVVAGNGFTVGFDKTDMTANRDIYVPNNASTAVTGIADPSDSQYVKYINQKGVAVRGTPAGGTSLSGLTAGAIPKALTSSTIGDSIVNDCGSNVVGVGACAGSRTGVGQLGQVELTAKASPATPSAGVGAAYVDSTTKRLSDKNDAGTIGNTVVGIANPSDSQFVKYVTPDGVQVRGVPAGGGGGAAAQVTRVRHDSTQTLVANTVLSVAFNAEQFDDAGWHSNVTNNSRITFDAAQACTISGNAQINITGSGGMYLFFRLNGTTELLSQNAVATAATAASLSVSTVYKFAASDYIELRALTTGSGGSISANEAVLSVLCFAT